MNHPNAVAILRLLAERHKRELQDVYWRILVYGSNSAESERLWWPDLTDPATLADGLGRVEVAA